MGTDWKERLKRQTEDERLLEAIKTGNYRTALMALFTEVRGVGICKHGSITNYQPCPQCVAEADEWMPEVEDE